MKEYIVKVFDDRTNWYNKEGQLHRDEAPAIEWVDGTKAWYQNGLLHRENGPAIEDANGHKVWWLNGKPHREDGPAVEDVDGYIAWWINGNLLTEEEFLKQTQPVQEMTMEEVCKALGKTIKIIK